MVKLKINLITKAKNVIQLPQQNYQELLKLINEKLFLGITDNLEKSLVERKNSYLSSIKISDKSFNVADDFNISFFHYFSNWLWDNETLSDEFLKSISDSDVISTQHLMKFVLKNSNFKVSLTDDYKIWIDWFKNPNKAIQDEVKQNIETNNITIKYIKALNQSVLNSKGGKK